ncbi:acyltransferase-like protein At3g26840, chloroplastic isoform X1 [Triticum aestivum]|uniref:acyltransferase-like protein At3g26840, chloroplastic isoform X1 n=1 Tax=Triticum aestivum TaxID=4565 RepID=UPI001D032A34|nr:acyltransferase-like protein At3g26840, chloroplastic isoform X1 [Triticum aestivum]
MAATPSAFAPARPRLLSCRAPGRRPAQLPRWTASATRSGAPSSSMDATAKAGRRPGVREYVEAAREMARRPDGGPPRWFAPLECGGGGGERVPGAPTLLYLPGIDGVGLGLIRHHERLAKMFDMWCLHIPVQDRTTFQGLVEHVERTVKSESLRAPDRPVYLVGESVGACIALAVAARNRDVDLVLVLVNPGTSFHRSQLQSLSALLDLVPDPFHSSTPQLLNFLRGNFMKMLSRFDGAGKALLEATSGLLPSLMYLADIFPKESIVWKMKMLRTASSFVNSRLHAVKAQILVVAGGNDELLPSREEAERLHGTLKKCRIRHFRDNGHKILLEDGFDLATTIKGAGYYRRSRQTDYVLDYLPVTDDELEKAIDRDRLLNFATDPVMLSTLPDGKIVRGLAGLPREGPVLLVGYHMLMGFELGPLVTGVLRSTGIHIRGLAHPFMFNESSEQLIPDSSNYDIHRIMGAVPVTAVNFYKLLSEKQFVLLYPGGAREALHRKVRIWYREHNISLETVKTSIVLEGDSCLQGEEYKLFWPEQSEFVRMASRFGAKIVPFGVVGEDDICDMLLDYNDLMKLPFYDILDKKLNEEGLKLRTDSTGEIKNQDMHPVVLTPKMPGRFYFIFGGPIETKGREKELRDKEKAQHLYLHVKSEVESCIKYLKEKREEDPYRSILPRLLYQAAHGSDVEIPTFEP